MDRIRELNRHSREVFRQIKEGVPPRPRPDTGGLNRNYVIEEHSAPGTEAGHTSLKLDFHPPDGMIGNRMCEDRASAKTRLRAMRGCCRSPSGSPEFGLTSKCGKLLRDMSRCGRCLRQNKLAIGNSSVVIA